MGETVIKFTAVWITAEIYAQLLFSKMFLMFRNGYLYMCCTDLDITKLSYLHAALRMKDLEKKSKIIEIN